MTTLLKECDETHAMYTRSLRNPTYLVCSTSSSVTCFLAYNQHRGESSRSPQIYDARNKDVLSNKICFAHVRARERAR